MFRVACPASICLVVAACGDSGPVASEANRGAPPASEVIAENDPAPVVDYRGAGPIPAPLHGMWALTPLDCERETAGPDAFIAVSGAELRFHGFSARPAGDVETTDKSISGTFAFEQGAQRWTRFQSLQVQEDKLIRTESGPMASYTYARCR